MLFLNETLNKIVNIDKDNLAKIEVRCAYADDESEWEEELFLVSMVKLDKSVELLAECSSREEASSLIVYIAQQLGAKSMKVSCGDAAHRVLHSAS